MVNLNQDERDQPTVPDRKPITLRLSYIPELADKITEALDFVLSKLKFYPVEKFIFSESFCSSEVTLTDAKGNVLTLIMYLLENDPGIRYIIFHTDDCLRDYHKYILAGVEFVNRPEYTGAGLQVDFLGYADNRYTLLEERTYTDS